MIPSLAVILTSTSRMDLGLTDERNEKIKHPMQHGAMVAAKLTQIKRLSIASALMHVSLAALVAAVLLIGIGWIEVRAEEALMLPVVALFFAALL